jgi:hypothetical protein
MYLLALSPGEPGHRRQNGTAGVNRRPPSPHRTLPGSVVRCEPEGIMPCHVRSASAPRKRRRPSLRLSPPRILATLDLTKEHEREAQAFVTGMCSGPRPSWRILGMARHGLTLYLAVQWVDSAEPRYCLAGVALDRIAVSMPPFPTAAAALAALAALDVQSRPPAAPDAVQGGAE